MRKHIFGPIGPWDHGLVGPYGAHGALWVPAGTRAREAAVPAPGVPMAPIWAHDPMVLWAHGPQHVFFHDLKFP